MSYDSSGEITQVRQSNDQQLIAIRHPLIYPGGGGQPPDKILLQSSAGIIKLEKTCWIDEEAYWIVEQPIRLSPGPINVEIDQLWRWEVCQQHTAQHLFSGFAFQRYGLESTGFSIFEEDSKIELLTEEDLEHSIADLELAVCQAIVDDLPVCTHLEPNQKRIVEIKGIDSCGCGGTHVKRTSQIGGFSILHRERKNKASLRITFAAGLRLGRIATHYTQWEQHLRKKLTGEVEERIDDLLAQLKIHSKHEKKWIQQLSPHLSTHKWLLIADLPPRMDMLRYMAGLILEMQGRVLLVADNGQFVLAGQDSDKLFKILCDHGVKGGGKNILNGTMDSTLIPKIPELIGML